MGIREGKFTHGKGSMVLGMRGKSGNWEAFSQKETEMGEQRAHYWGTDVIEEDRNDRRGNQ